MWGSPIRRNVMRDTLRDRQIAVEAAARELDHAVLLWEITRSTAHEQEMIEARKRLSEALGY